MHDWHESTTPEDDAVATVKKARAATDAEMDITPMIDVTFLMLIFFLVASTPDSRADSPDEQAAMPTPATTSNGRSRREGNILISLSLRRR